MIRRGAICLLLLLVAPVAGATQIGSIFSGPVGRDAAVLYYNPAGMTLLQGTQGMLFGALSAVRLQYQRDTPSLFDGSPYPEADIFVPKPGFALGIVSDATLKRLRFGIGLTLPLLEGGSWSDSYGGRPSSTRYYAVRARLLKFLISPVVAYQVTSWLSVGGGIDVIGALLKHEAYTDFGGKVNQLICKSTGVTDCPMDAPLLREDTRYQGLTAINGFGLGVGINLGVLMTPTPWLRIGFGFHSGAPVTVSSDVEVQVPTAVADFVARNLPSIQLPALEAKGDVQLTMPRVLTAGVTLRLNPRLEIGADFHFMGLSQTQVMLGNITESSTKLIADQVLVKGRSDGMLLGLLGVYRLGSLRGALRMEYEANTRPERFVSPVSLDFHKLSFHFGIAWAINETFGLTAEFSHYFLFTRTIRVSTFAPNGLPLTPVAEGLDKPPPTGTYTGVADRVGISVYFRL